MTFVAKFSEEIKQKILDAISKRLPFEMAAYVGGISPRCFNKWLSKGIEDLQNGIESDHSKLVQDVKKIEAERITAHINRISDSEKNWQAQAWILERRWNKHFSANAGLEEILGRITAMEQKQKEELQSQIENKEQDQ